MHEIHVIGLGPGRLTLEATAVLRRCRCVAAPASIAAFLPPLDGEVIPLVPLEEALDAIDRHAAVGEVAVLASGDPLFFGIGRSLLRRFPPERLVFTPAISSVQLAAARFGIPWEDAAFLSVHGRSRAGIAQAIMPHETVFVCTDRDNSPARVAADLLDSLEHSGLARHAGAYTAHVGENLGRASERLFSGSLAEAAASSFAEPNLLVLVREGVFPCPAILGLTEQEIEHPRGLITKDEIRAAVLHRLAIPHRGVFWDIGAGSGSIAIEAARLAPRLAVHAVERSAEQLGHIEKNRTRHGAMNVEVHASEAPSCLGDLPDPDRVFVGGSGGRLPEILAEAARRLNPRGRIVLTAVTAKTRAQAPALLHELGFAVSLSEITVRRQTYPPTPDDMKLNPITLITGMP